MGIETILLVVGVIAVVAIVVAARKSKQKVQDHRTDTSDPDLRG